LAHDLKVVFADLTLDQPQAAGDVDSTVMRWPQGVFWPPRVFDAAKDARLLLNREMIDVVQRNLNASFSLLRKVAGARSFGEVIELQASHLSNQVTALIGQSNELGTLLAKTAMEFMRGAYLGRGDLR
jgi:Phasin protein